MNLVREILRLVTRGVLVTVGVVLGTFVLLTIVPGDVTSALLGSRATPERTAELGEQFGLDRPWNERLWSFLGDVVSGGGVSYVSGRPVGDQIRARIGPTLLIVGLALIIAVVLSATLAVVAAARHNRLADQSIRVVSTAGVAVPSFLLGMVLILVFGVWLRWLPVGGTRDALASYVLPAFTAAFAIVPVVTRSLRVQLLDIARSDFVVAARAAGLSEARVTFTYLLPNASIPAITLVGVNVAYLIGGTFIVEKVFAVQGLGALMFDAIQDRDVPVVQGVVLCTAIGVVIVNVLTELLVRLVDPRLRTRRAQA